MQEAPPRRVTLTFDNGPTPGVTEQVLDILAVHSAPANFFAVGAKLADSAGAACAARAVAEGHLLGGHTWSHSVPFGRATADIVDRELDATRAAVDRLGGDGRRFRPYGVGGSIDDRLMSAYAAARLRADGYTCVLWNSVPGDWRDPRGWIDAALADISSRPWSVVVLHDIIDAALERLDEFLHRLASLGIEFRLDTPDSCTPLRDGRPTGSYALLGVN